MVKNRALKRDSRVIKASTGITYPRALNQATRSSPAAVSEYAFVLGTDDLQPLTYRPSYHGHLLVTGEESSARDSLLQGIAADTASVMKVRVLAPWSREESVLFELERTMGNLSDEVRELAEDATGLTTEPHTMLIIDARWLLLGSSAENSDEDQAYRSRLAVHLDHLVYGARKAGFVIVAAVRDTKDASLFTATAQLKALASILSIETAGTRPDGTRKPTRAVFSAFGVGGFPMTLQVRPAGSS